jgi:two-component system sensor histidine kinase KdpD
MTDQNRPDPDALLANLKQEEARLNKGRLRVFMGMCAGVGKTYAMLEAGAKARWEGVDAVIGLVETHGRFDTAALVDSLPTFPRRKIEHRGTPLTEMDLDGLLQRHPKLVLVDELAHTNVAGSRHPKRWQDVLELLDAGIDVFTTVNVQHLESRKDSVEAITGVPVRETVPDSILERADQVEVIDIAPSQLLERLAEGKVYPGDKAVRAAANFFKPDTLTALREIALRVTAERVDKELRALSVNKGAKGAWNTNERVMVAVSPSPNSERLVRTARRLAASLQAPWLAVHVNDGVELAEKDREQLRKNLALAEELGAQVVNTADGDLAAALLRVAASQDVSQLVMGRPRRGVLQDLLSGGSLLGKLTRQAGDLDIHVVRLARRQSRRLRGLRRFRLLATPVQYWYTLWVVAAMGAVGEVAERLIGYRAVGFIFLCALLGLSLFTSMGPVLFAAVLSALVWDYFFIPPKFTFVISTSEDVLMIVAYFLAAVITGALTHRLRRNQRALQERERRTDLLYRLVTSISTGQREQTLREVAGLLASALKRPVCVFLSDGAGRLRPQGHGPEVFALNDKETAVAVWSLQSGKPAGWGTSNLPTTDAHFVPLQGRHSVVGVLALRGGSGPGLSLEDEALLKAASQQLGLSLEHEGLQKASREAERLRESEQLHQALLNSVSHELRTPLTALLGTATALQDEATASDPARRGGLLKDLASAGGRLNRVIENLLDMARLNSGVLAPQMDWHDPAELVRLTVQRLAEPLSGHPIHLDLLDELPLVKADYRFMEHALSNLLLNAAAYAPAGSAITAAAHRAGGRLELTVSDQGPGIPPDQRERVFEKFYRLPGSPAGGTGLGLHITRSLLRAQGGDASVRPAQGGGAEFVLSLPILEAPAPPPTVEIS